MCARAGAGEQAKWLRSHAKRGRRGREEARAQWRGGGVGVGGAGEQAVRARARKLEAGQAESEAAAVRSCRARQRGCSVPGCAVVKQGGCRWRWVVSGGGGVDGEMEMMMMMCGCVWCVKFEAAAVSE